MTRVLIANSLTGLGKVSMANQQLVLGSQGIETLLLPTVLMSSHTGGFTDIAKVDLEEFTVQTLRQWEALNLQIDAALIGYCPNKDQLKHIFNFCQKQAIPIFFDPIMGDNGKLYKGFDDNYYQNLLPLIKHCHTIFPNITEACLLTGIPYTNEEYNPHQIGDMMRKLAHLGADQIILTGVKRGDEVGMVTWEKEYNHIQYYGAPYIEGHFFGTGDLLTSSMTAGIIQRQSLDKVANQTLQFIQQAILSTIKDGRHPKEGLLFEQHLHILSDKKE